MQKTCVNSQEEGDLTLLFKNNTLERASKEKKETAHVLNKALLELLGKLKSF